MIVRLKSGLPEPWSRLALDPGRIAAMRLKVADRAAQAVGRAAMVEVSGTYDSATLAMLEVSSAEIVPISRRADRDGGPLEGGLLKAALEDFDEVVRDCAASLALLDVSVRVWIRGEGGRP